MRTLELRLEDVEYCWNDTGLLKAPKYDIERAQEDHMRMTAALEFFDRALAGMLSNRGAEDAFKCAVDGTLLRFGVRIVGLKSAEPGEKGEEGHGSLPW